MDKNKLNKKNRRDDQNFSLNKPYLLKRKFDNDKTINCNILKFLSISQREFFFSDLLEF